MALRLVQVNFKAADDSALGRFWAASLGWGAFSGESGATGVMPVGSDWPLPAAAVNIDVIAVPYLAAVKDRAHIELFSELPRVSRDQVRGRSVLRGRAGERLRPGKVLVSFPC